MLDLQSMLQAFCINLLRQISIGVQPREVSGEWLFLRTTEQQPLAILIPKLKSIAKGSFIPFPVRTLVKLSRTFFLITPIPATGEA